MDVTVTVSSMLNALHQLTIEILLYRKINTLNFEPKMSILTYFS